MIVSKNDSRHWVTIGMLRPSPAKQPDDWLAQSAGHMKGAAVSSYDKAGGFNYGQKLKD